MPSPLRARVLRALAALMLLAALVIPGSAPALGADDEPLILRAGTDQDLQVLNPWQSTLVVDYEAFTLNYDLLVGFGPNLKPAPGFADTWESSSDGMTHTFHIRDGHEVVGRRAGHVRGRALDLPARPRCRSRPNMAASGRTTSSRT